jgi:hypothetical protein
MYARQPNLRSSLEYFVIYSPNVSRMLFASVADIGRYVGLDVGWATDW